MHAIPRFHEFNIAGALRTLQSEIEVLHVIGSAQQVPLPLDTGPLTARQLLIHLCIISQPLFVVFLNFSIIVQGFAMQSSTVPTRRASGGCTLCRRTKKVLGAVACFPSHPLFIPC